MLFTREGRLARHIRAPTHERRARASTGKLGGIGRGERALTEQSVYALSPQEAGDEESLEAAPDYVFDSNKLTEGSDERASIAKIIQAGKVRRHDSGNAPLPAASASRLVCACAHRCPTRSNGSARTASCGIQRGERSLPRLRPLPAVVGGARLVARSLTPGARLSPRPRACPSPPRLSLVSACVLPVRSSTSVGPARARRSTGARPGGVNDALQ